MSDELQDHLKVTELRGRWTREKQEQVAQKMSDIAATSDDNGEDDEESPVSNQDRYIDARLAGIEKDLDNRLADMQRQADQADKRLDKALAEMRADGKMTRTTVITTSVGVVGLVAAILFGTLTAFQQTVSEQGEAMRQSVSEQSAWLRQSVDRIEQRVEAIPISLPAEEQLPSSPEQNAPAE